MVINMKRLFAAVLFALLSAAMSFAAPNTVEIFYLPHAPAEAVVRDVEAVLKKHSGFKVAKYSFEDPGNRKLLAKYQLTRHQPVVIFVNGKSTFAINKRTVVFENFPKGNAFVPMFEGNWSYQDLDSVLQTVEKGK